MKKLLLFTFCFVLSGQLIAQSFDLRWNCSQADSIDFGTVYVGEPVEGQIFLSRENTIPMLEITKRYPKALKETKKMLEINWRIEKSSNFQVYDLARNEIGNNIIFQTNSELIIRFSPTSKNDVGYLKLFLGNNQVLYLVSKATIKQPGRLVVNDQYKILSFDSVLIDSVKTLKVVLRNDGDEPIRVALNDVFNLSSNEYLSFSPQDFVIVPSSSKEIVVNFKSPKFVPTSLSKSEVRTHQELPVFFVDNLNNKVEINVKRSSLYVPNDTATISYTTLVIIISAIVLSCSALILLIIKRRTVINAIMRLFIISTKQT